MYCSHCGKENTAGNQFCEHCGKPMTQQTTAQPNMPPRQNTPPQQAYPWQQTNIDPEVKRKWEEQKAREQEKRLHKRVRATSVIWLIAGILQALVGLIFIIVGAVQVLFILTGESSYDVIEKFIYISRIFFGGAMLLMGSFGIRAFVASKKKQAAQSVHKLSVPITLLITQFVIVVLTFLPPSGPILRRDMFLAALLLTPAIFVPAILDIVNIAAIRKREGTQQNPLTETSKKRTVLFFGTIILIACLTIVSLVFSYIHNQKWIERNREENRIINLVRNGTLKGYPDMPIEETLETELARIDKSTYRDDDYDYINVYNWEYDPYRPQHSYYEDHNTGKELAPDDVLVTMWFSYEPEEDEVISIYITFMLNETNHEITIYAISSRANGTSHTFNDDEIAEWTEDFFGGRQKLIEQGENYLKNGVYVPNTQYFYSSPDEDSLTDRQYQGSYNQNVYDYLISDSGKLWLKIQSEKNGKTYEWWIPAPKNN